MIVEASALVFVGTALLALGADRFIEGAAATASLLRVPPFVIGAGVVGFATSAPEILVSGVAAAEGKPLVGIANAIGSNIANIGLVLGMTAIIAPVSVRPNAEQSLFLGFPGGHIAMLAAMLFATLLLADNELTRRDGILLVMGISIVSFLTYRYGMRERGRGLSVTVAEDSIKGKDRSTRMVFFQLIFGFTALLLGSKLLVSGATDIARSLGLSDIVIGLTILAVGTSLPELAASLASALKNRPEIALGNIIGSNIFNSLAVLAVPALISPATTFGPEIMRRDVPFMLALAVALVLMARLPRLSGCISRTEGLLLFGAFAGYQYFLF